jgi:cytochrome c-type biogenesis protein CcmH/NrfG
MKTNQTTVASAAPLVDVSADTPAMDALRQYANTIDDKAQSNAVTPAKPEAATLPDVDSMISKLVARLEKQPDDVKGWKMLAWSYLNTDKVADATRAYETALKLDPNDPEIKKGLEAAKSGQPPTIDTNVPPAHSTDQK